MFPFADNLVVTAWFSLTVTGNGLFAQRSFLVLQGILEASKARDIPIVIDAVSVASPLLPPAHCEAPKPTQ